MFDLINNLTVTALDRFGDEASKRFYASLREKRFETTRCDDCSSSFFPPRTVCPHCSSERISWITLSGEGKVYAFTQQEKPTRFPKPDVVGVIELAEGGDIVGRIMARIDAPFKDVSIDAPVIVDFLDISKKLTLPQFRLRK